MNASNKNNSGFTSTIGIIILLVLALSLSGLATYLLLDLSEQNQKDEVSKVTFKEQGDEVIVYAEIYSGKMIVRSSSGKEYGTISGPTDTITIDDKGVQIYIISHSTGNIIQTRYI